MRSQSVWQTVWLGVLVGLAALLMYLEIPLPLFPAYLKYDLGDFPALLAGLALGPAAGISVELGKETLFLMLRGSTLVGVAANLLVGVTWVGVSATVYRRWPGKFGLALALSTGGLIMTAVMAVANWFVFLPIWGIPAEAIPATVTSVIVPFNLVKVVLTGTVTFALYPKVQEAIGKSEAGYWATRRSGYKPNSNSSRS